MRKVSQGKSSVPDYFLKFKTPVDHIEPPTKFTFPFYYEPHELAKIASTELQDYLINQEDFDHNFGIEKNQDGLIIGKMFGVLVVKNKTTNEIGFLAAVSGKLATTNEHKCFVPPVFDMLTKDSFFIKEEKLLNKLTEEIQQLKQSPNFTSLLKKELEYIENEKKELADFKIQMKKAKKKRDEVRKNIANYQSDEEKQVLIEKLNNESIKNKIHFKQIKYNWNQKKNAIASEINYYRSEIEEIKNRRKLMSASLQKRIFDQYEFLNIRGERKGLSAIFDDFTGLKPPAGAGECAAPKLLHYAFLNDLKPVALAEFWWGESPASEVRKHKQFYPACKGKCEPILDHMLKGLELDPNPFKVNHASGKELPVIYEDDVILVVNKPSEFLSVPGKQIKDSVYERIKNKYPDATGPLLVHRLDMSTSGILLIAKTKEAHQFLQRQFIKRQVEKRYIALLDCEIEQNKGFVELPLRVDLDDRPRQLVCYEHGKKAKTRWQVIERTAGKTKVYFYPLTGRTHQLRVHAAHSLGLNAPIVGDDLYGKKDRRLYLHAEKLVFVHPTTRKQKRIQVKAEF